MVLDRNCRNTGQIHTAAYRFYRGEAVEAPDIPGAELELLVATGIEKQARAIAVLVTKLVAEEKVPPHEIAVLLCSTADRELREQALAATTIPRSAKFGRLEKYAPGSVTVESVARFKGLERGVIILWAFEGCTPTGDRETLYVGMSRAKSLLYLCGSQEACERLMADVPAEEVVAG